MTITLRNLSLTINRQGIYFDREEQAMTVHGFTLPVINSLRLVKF